MTSARRFSRPAVLFAALYLAGCLDVDPPTQPGPPDVFLAVPEGWLANYGDFAGVGLSKAHAHSGTTAAYISGQGTAPVQATMMQFIQAEQYVGKRVRYSAWLKPQKLKAPFRASGCVLMSPNTRSRLTTWPRGRFWERETGDKSQ